LRLGTGFGNEFRGILCRSFECIDEISFAFLLVLTLFVLLAAGIDGTLFPELSFVLFLFFESVGGLFFALDVEFDQSGVFGAVRLYPGFRLSDVDVVYQVESCKRDSRIRQ
jgi:hypothetical protein